MGREKRWRFRFHDAQRIRQLEQTTGVAPLVAHLLSCRGLDHPDTIERFLQNRLSELHPPADLPGIEAAVAGLHAALTKGQKICIYGDYDVDGMSATAILVSCLRALGGDVIYYIPHRLEEGYGLNCEALTELAGQGVCLVVSVDCGIGSIEEATRARQLGLQLIITDHHAPGPVLPEALAVVHPSLPGTAYPFAGLCGAGVALKLAWALCQRVSGTDKVTDRLRNLLMRWLGLAALATVADVVPLVEENRAIVRHGLFMLRDDPVPGVAQLMRRCKLDAKRELASEDIAFALAPRLNAAGRLGYARLGAELLMTESQERAAALAEHIDQLNQSREKLERRILVAANRQIEAQFDPQTNPAFVLADAEWHAGVVGIVAGRIAERYNRPTILIALDGTGLQPGIGSARTAGGLNLYEALRHCSEHLVSHGGHAAAAGLRIDAERVEAFRADFCEYVAGESTDADTRPELSIDLEASLSLLTLTAVEQLEQLAPFGQGNPRPVFCATEVGLVGAPKRMGGGDRHLSLQIEQSRVKLRGVAFGKGEWADELAAVQGPIDIAFRPVINEFAGRRKVEMHLIDWRVSQPAERPGSPLTGSGRPLR